MIHCLQLLQVKAQKDNISGELTVSKKAGSDASAAAFAAATAAAASEAKVRSSSLQIRMDRCDKEVELESAKKVHKDKSSVPAKDTKEVKQDSSKATASGPSTISFLILYSWL